MGSLTVSDSTLTMLRELTMAENASAQTVLERALVAYRRESLQSTGSNAPDGLPWPRRYFDCPPKITLEDAVVEYGLRPQQYLKGWPVYSTEEMRRPEFKSKLREEPPELQAQWDAQMQKWESAKKTTQGMHAEQ